MLWVMQNHYKAGCWRVSGGHRLVPWDHYKLPVEEWSMDSVYPLYDPVLDIVSDDNC